MSEMIERVTAVAATELARQGQESRTYVGGFDGTSLEVDGFIDVAALVRVFIKAMREPTEEMVEEGWRYIAVDSVSGVTQDGPKAVWQAMIDAAPGRLT
jgi:hypothetical protein